MDKILNFINSMLKYKLIRYGLLFLMVCFGLLILGASKVDFFGISIENEDNIEFLELLDNKHGHEHEYGRQKK